jgi:hypothetical protein
LFDDRGRVRHLTAFTLPTHTGPTPEPPLR